MACRGDVRSRGGGGRAARGGGIAQPRRASAGRGSRRFRRGRPLNVINSSRELSVFCSAAAQGQGKGGAGIGRVRAQKGRGRRARGRRGVKWGAAAGAAAPLARGQYPTKPGRRRAAQGVPRAAAGPARGETWQAVRGVHKESRRPRGSGLRLKRGAGRAAPANGHGGGGGFGALTP
ncbi:MAG: hypothetical protein J3K34DRAFT_30993 [Monoraphidium minutum]|nr:MAG: hypothetical protein J3K34DRAFT_30993 [Monoraphidium minutum]